MVWPVAAGAAGFLIASFCGANGTGETTALSVAGGEASITGGLSDSAATLAGAAEVETARESLGAGGGAIGCALAVTGGALGCRVTGTLVGVG
jgi:ABC-type molybdenum transport system ATPase subunit/photorepair protein PhrA